MEHYLSLNQMLICKLCNLTQFSVLKNKQSPPRRDQTQLRALKGQIEARRLLSKRSMGVVIVAVLN